MSYARFGAEGSDVYVFESSVGIECCGCDLAEGAPRVVAETVEEMLEHLRAHRDAGHAVPDSAFEQLIADQADGVLR